jgi:hypothetical protein
MQTLIKAGEVINGGLYRAAPLNARFDEQLIAPNIAPAELRFLLPILCREFYDDLIAEQNAAVANYNPNIGALVPKFPTNASYESLWTDGGLGALNARIVYFISLPYISMQTGSNGIYHVETEHAKTVKMLSTYKITSLRTLKHYQSTCKTTFVKIKLITLYFLHLASVLMLRAVMIVAA